MGHKFPCVQVSEFYGSWFSVVAEVEQDSGAEVANFISEYKVNANPRNKLHFTTLDIVEYSMDDDGNDETRDSLHAASEEGNHTIDTSS